MDIGELVKRIKTESKGFAMSKVLPDPYHGRISDLSIVATLNIGPENKYSEYINRKGTGSRFLRYALGAPLWEFMTPPSVWSGEEILECIPIGEVESGEMTVNLPCTQTGTGIPVGKKEETKPYKAKLVSYKMGNNSAIRYMASSALSEHVRGCFSVTIRLEVPTQLAQDFMGYAQGNLNNVWEALSEGLFPGVFGSRQKIELEGNELEGNVVPAGNKSGTIYFRNLSEQELEKTGFKFGARYLSKRDELYNRIHGIYDEDERRIASGRERIEDMGTDYLAYGAAGALFKELRQKGVGLIPNKLIDLVMPVSSPDPRFKKVYIAENTKN